MNKRLGWRWVTAVIVYACALLALQSGVSLSERPGVEDSGLLVKIYYSFGVFVLGGLDLGTPLGGPVAGRVLLWIAYFAGPLLAASAVIQTAEAASKGPAK